MHSRLSVSCLLFCGSFSLFAAAEAAAQQPETKQQLFAPGVVTVIPATPEEKETSRGPFPLPEIVKGMVGLEYDPHYTSKSQTLHEKAKIAILRGGRQELEFAFKPLRMIYVDVPQPNGKMRRKLIWYMVYRVKNNGSSLTPVAKEDKFGNKTYKPQQSTTATMRFFPTFALQSKEHGKEYLDRIIPVAMAAIQRREMPKSNIKLHNSVEISKIPIALSDERTDRSVWGVVTWEDIDPRIDYFSIYVQGLSNAYQFVDPPEGFKAGDPPGTGRVFTQKTLQLNFWRPGDTIAEHEGEIRFGVRIDTNSDKQKAIFKQYGVKRRLDYLWVYR